MTMPLTGGNMANLSEWTLEQASGETHDGEHQQHEDDGDYKEV